jgi:hypothetical protein
LKNLVVLPNKESKAKKMKEKPKPFLLVLFAVLMILAIEEKRRDKVPNCSEPEEIPYTCESNHNPKAKKQISQKETKYQQNYLNKRKKRAAIVSTNRN